MNADGKLPSKVWKSCAVAVMLCAAAVVAEGAFMDVDGDPVDYVKIRLWKEDGELKSEFWGMETEFWEIAGDFRRIAGRGHADWPVHWLVGGEVTVRELSEKMGTLAALGFTNQFFMAGGATERQVLEFDLGNAWEWPEEEFQGEEESREEGGTETARQDGDESGGME